jgi:hypothetical protein
LKRGEGFHEFEFLPVYAIRAYTVRTRDFASAIRFLRSVYHLDDGVSPGPQAYAAYTVAFLLRTSGQAARADQIPDLQKPRSGMSYEEITYAFMPMAKGRRDESLAALSRFAATDRHYPYWWTFDSDPMWDGVRTDPRLVAFVKKQRSQAREQHEQLSNMQRNGALPRRLLLSEIVNPAPTQ